MPGHGQFPDRLDERLTTLLTRAVDRRRRSMPQSPGPGTRTPTTRWSERPSKAAIEQVTGEAFHVVFDRLLSAPLGLDDTSSYPHAPRSGRPAAPDTCVRAKDVVLQPDGALRHQVPDGGIISTLHDQVRSMTALVTGEVVTDAGTWARMQRRLARVFFPSDYGLGVMRYAPPRWMSPMLAVPPLVGHTGSTATWLFHCSQLGIVTSGTFDVAQAPLPFRFLPLVLRAVYAGS